MVTIRCDEYGFDCDYSTTGNVEGMVFDYWNHMKNEHGIEYSVGTLGKYIKKKLPKQIPT